MILKVHTKLIGATYKSLPQSSPKCKKSYKMDLSGQFVYLRLGFEIWMKGGLDHERTRYA